MKTIVVMFLLSLSMIILVTLLDFAMGFGRTEIISKQIKPFRVSEKTDITIMVLFALYFVIKVIVGFVKQIQQNNGQ
ncbi:hypothetical protein [Neobacillus kokaensis]|uniref:Uncharacterized protein n=1 Tax=Neobacillus kokaensis TaxID=2759023 RepID=A0ABQ3N013_9BACI|nr:hypothetical protein [Neobacillus kokaensis]GHH96843.1 hypothetical protein AM1BK_03860 [Neobacillus kokaensis]